MDALTDDRRRRGQAGGRAGATRPSPSPTTAWPQSFPDAMKASKAKVAGTDQNIKILYGCEGYLRQRRGRPHCGPRRRRTCPSTRSSSPSTWRPRACPSSTTRIIEIGAVVLTRRRDRGPLPDLRRPRSRIPDQKIIELTGITDAMLVGAPDHRGGPAGVSWTSAATGPWRPTTPTSTWALSPPAAARYGIALQSTYIDTPDPGPEPAAGAEQVQAEHRGRRT